LKEVKIMANKAEIQDDNRRSLGELLMVEALGGDLSAAIALKKSAMNKEEIAAVEAEIQEWKNKN